MDQTHHGNVTADKGIQQIPMVSVSYNSAELIAELLGTFRTYYSNPVTIIDGSDAEHVAAIAEVCAKYRDVKFIHFDYNIHHGPGMAWAYQNLGFNGRVLVLDSDIQVLNHGLLESLAAELKPNMYGVGCVSYVNEQGFDQTSAEGNVRYLHPACMLINMEVVRAWPMPVKHGAPNIDPMLAIHREGKHELIAAVGWVADDFSRTHEPKKFLRHDWQGTVKRTGGYHLEEWQKSVLQQSNIAANSHPTTVSPEVEEENNRTQDLIKLIPSEASGILEIGCGRDELAIAYKKINSAVPLYHLDANIDSQNNATHKLENVTLFNAQKLHEIDLSGYVSCNVWVLNKILERLPDPQSLLKSIRRFMTADSYLIACIPNAQHWTIQAKLSIGDFRYQTGGLLDNGHLRFFTRATMLELFNGAGFNLQQGFPRTPIHLQNPQIISAIRTMAIGVGADPNQALQDSMPSEYIVRMVPG